MYHIIANAGAPGATTKFTSSDTAQNLSTIFTNANGAPAVGAIITCESNPVRFTMGGNIATPTIPPTAAGLGHILYEGQSLALSSAKQVRTFQFINHTALSNGILQVTPLFELGA